MTKLRLMIGMRLKNDPPKPPPPTYERNVLIISDYSDPIQVDLVKIRILKTGSQSWYANQVGKVVKAIREITVDDEGTEWAQYKQYPRPKGYEPSGHYVAYEIEEVNQRNALDKREDL